MFIYTLKFDRKKAIFIVIMAALILFGIIMLVTIDAPEKAETSNAKISTDEKGANYLASLGWKVELPALNKETVLIPKTFNDIFDKYNALQLSQGYDLKEYAGKEVNLYTYKVTNHNSNDTVYAQLYVYKNKVIGGDIHSSSLDGFMCGLKNANPG
ncbi:MAG: DUF4830 domain-containing protein [Ruminococcaceae bacterium]|nr:DUF4830 domain-containing protein [Oscillospiraceae bacterium]MBE7017460.1 DUF4830 domain-containing protein [Oscillospiraceae bacterium]